MKVVQPISITSENLVDSNLFDIAPAAYAAGTTYALGAYVGVAGTLGEVLIYQSLQAGNTGHTPSSSPTWWVYVSSTYETYNAAKYYPLKHRVLSPTTGRIFESLIPKNISRSLEGTASWLPTGKTTLTLPAAYNSGTTYIAGDLVKTSSAIGSDFVNEEGYSVSTIVTTVLVYVSKVAANTGNTPSISPSQWELLKSYPVPYEITGNYMLGFVVKDVDGNIYQSMVDNNYNTPLVAPVAWLDVSPSSRGAMFDSQTVTQSVANKKISVTVASGIIDTVALVNTDAELATITVRDGLGGIIVFQKTIGLTGGNPTNAWDYYFGDPTVRITQAVVEGIPPYVNSHVTVEITGNSEVKVGNLIMGKSVDMGLTITGATAGILDFSTKTTDTFGQTTFVKRGYKKTLAVQVEVQKERTNKLQNTLYALRSQPCLWVSTNDPELSEPLVLFGFYKDFSTEISYPTYSLCSIEIEGLI